MQHATCCSFRFTTFCSVFLLAVHGQEEDAFTILRRILELGAQLEYIHQGDAHEMAARASQYLEQDPDVGSHYWWGGSFGKLFRNLGLQATHESDYRFLAQTAHGAAKRVLPAVQDGIPQIRSTEFFTPLLVFASMYTLGAAKVWNTRFSLLQETTLNTLASESLDFRKRLLEEHGQAENPGTTSSSEEKRCE